MDRESASCMVKAVPYWRHKIHLPFGLVTPGRVGRELITRLKLPNDLTGCRVLDIGTFDGLCAFEAERRNASDVLAIDTWHGQDSDNPEWWNDVHTGGLGFVTAKKILGSSVRSQELSVYQLNPAIVGTFDYVLMCGLLYHLKNPLRGLKKALSVTHGTLILESEVISIGEQDSPIGIFSGWQNRNIHPSVWWEFSSTAIKHLCYSAGAGQVNKVSITWHPNSIRYFENCGNINLYSSPKTKSAKIGNIQPGRTIKIESRRPTYRDGYLWLRGFVDSFELGQQLRGWLRFSSEQHLPPIREEPCKDKKKYGRIVMWVSP